MPRNSLSVPIAGIGMRTFRGNGWRQPETTHPGSSAAIRAGCTCSPVRNCYGRGHGEPDSPIFDAAPDCPLHGVSLASVPARGICCAKCGTELQVDGDEDHLVARCPTGCPLPNEPLALPAARPTANAHYCTRCGAELSKKMGRPRKSCDACLTPAEHTQLERQRQAPASRARRRPA